MAGDRGPLRREVRHLVGLVLVVHGLFVAGYFVAGLATAPENRRFGYMIAWTAVALVVVLRGLGRVRAARLRARRGQ
jgi:hypothetical protein